MPSGRGCPPGRDFEEDDCRQLKKVPSLKFRKVGRYKGWLPKCFLWNGKLVFYNTGGIEPPTRGKNVHKAICKTKRTSTTTTTTTTSLQSPLGKSSSHI